jgi:hypothetical protein
MVWGTMPIDALIGGLPGDQIGLRPTMDVSAPGSMLAVSWVRSWPVRQCTSRRQRRPDPTALAAQGLTMTLSRIYNGLRKIAARAATHLLMMGG